MNIILIIITIINTSLLLVALYVIFKKNNNRNDDELLRTLEEKNKHNVDQIISLAKEKLESEKSEIKTDLRNKKESIKELVDKMYKEMRTSQDKLEKAEKERIGTLKSLSTEIESHKKITEQLSVSTENLKKILSNNQLRGQFGEQIAEDLLKMAGFVKGTDYEANKAAETGTRPDFAIFMPDGKRINVDAKFPYSNLQKLTATEDKESKAKYLKGFERDVKEKIKQVTNREYIDPANGTVDFVILFIPNEMIFSFIYDKMDNLWSDAMRDKVVLAGPFSFTAILRMIRQSYESFKFQENAAKIISYVKEFQKQFDKYSDEFEKVGKYIEQLSKKYNEVDGVRTRQLLRTVDKIVLEEGGDNTLKVEGSKGQGILE